MYLSKVRIAWRAVDNDGPLGEATYLVATKGNAASEVVGAAMKESEKHTLNDVRIDSIRIPEVIFSVSDRDAAKIADRLAEEESLEDADLDELVHETASALAGDANNRGIQGQIEFLKKYGPDCYLAQVLAEIP